MPEWIFQKTSTDQQGERFPEFEIPTQVPQKMIMILAR